MASDHMSEEDKRHKHNTKLQVRSPYLLSIPVRLKHPASQLIHHSRWHMSHSFFFPSSDIHLVFLLTHTGRCRFQSTSRSRVYRCVIFGKCVVKMSSYMLCQCLFFLLAAKWKGWSLLTLNFPKLLFSPLVASINLSSHTVVNIVHLLQSYTHATASYPCFLGPLDLIRFGLFGSNWKSTLPSRWSPKVCIQIERQRADKPCSPLIIIGL